jgi:hypothetical protein
MANDRFVVVGRPAGVGQKRTAASRFQGVCERADDGHLLTRPGNTTEL